MRVAVQEMPGVASAEVSLEEGEVTVALEEGNQVRLDALRQVIRNQGFTPRDADIRARGVVERRGDRFLFRTPGGEVVLDVDADPSVVPALEERAGRPLVVQGRVEEGSTRIRVTSVTPG